MTTYRVAYLPGDGIGPEVTAVARRCVDALGDRFGYAVAWDEQLVGGAAMDAVGAAAARRHPGCVPGADAVLLGAVGGPAWDDPAARSRPEDALLGLRSALELFANLRPVRAHESLPTPLPATGGPARRRHPHRPGAHRRPLLRAAAGPRGVRRRGRRWIRCATRGRRSSESWSSHSRSRRIGGAG